MKRWFWLLLIPLMALAGCCNCLFGGKTMTQEPMLAHSVFFTLNDNSAGQKERLLEECYTYLKDHPGVTFFSAGLRDTTLTREVNDQAFDVALTIVFKTRKNHEDYQVAAKHKEFIQRNQANWKQVRVFDSLVW